MATNNFLDKTGLALVWSKIKLLLADKVDKVDGKGLSSNDYTADEKAKLANIAAGAEVNVNADWTATTGDAAILHKPTIPTATSQLTNDSGFITTSDIPEGAAASTTVPLMDGTAAVGTELAFARGDHVHPSDTSKVDKVNGKGLSTNDYTTTEKNKLAGIAEGANNYTLPTASADTLGGIKVGANLTITNGVLSADAQAVDEATTTTDGLMSAADKVKLNGIDASADVNVIEAITVNGNATTVTNKTVNVAVPTNNNQLTNGAGYQTASDVNSLISTAIGDLEGVSFSVVNSLPATGDSAVIYLVADTHSDSNDAYDEYIWLSSANKYEKIGNTDVDLSDYYNTTNLVAITNAEINTICV